MNIPKKQRRPDIYDPNLKIAVAREYLTSDLGYGRLASKYNISSVATVVHFVKWYRNKYPQGVIEHPVVADNSEKITIDVNELKDANLKIAALEMLIQNAGKELGVDLVKKFGTKQPKK